MKNNRKSLKRHIARSHVRKRDKEKNLKREIIGIADGMGVGTRGAKIRLSDTGYGGKRENRSRDIMTVGIFSEAAGGFGFVTSTDYSGGDIFIPRGCSLSALSGDTVELYFHEYRDREGRCRTEGRVSKILSYGRSTLTGTLITDYSFIRGKRKKTLRIIPDGGKTKRTVFALDTDIAREGDKVLGEILRDKIYPEKMTVRITASFGPADTRSANYLAILNEGGISTEFTAEELLLAEEVAAAPIEESGRERIEDIVFTIDSESAKDLDDAVSLKRTEWGYTLGVHIADVSSYVKEKTALDRLVMARGTSIYFTDKVVPMLPEALSCGACSLNPGEDKYTLSAIIELSPSGEILSAKILPTIIRSRIKGIYSEINRIFENGADEDILNKYRDCLPTLRIMHELYLILAERAKKRGAMTLDTEEAYITLNEAGEPCDIIKRERGDAERLIEQFMLTANEAVATLLTDRGIPCVYRVHERPPLDKLIDFAAYAKNLGFDTRRISAEDATAGDFAALLEVAEERGLSLPISYTMLRSMSKAVYSEVRQAHFGLGISTYCHFTSPIRRLSDLATHRIIHRVLLEGKPAERYRSYAKRAAACATEGELRAVAAERKIENLYKVIYMKDRVGEEFPAVISGISSFGFFARLENTCEGLVPLSELPGMFVFDEKNITIHDNKRIFKLGEAVTVRLEEADISAGKLRFSLVN